MAAKVLIPKNKQFLKDFHDNVVSSNSQLVEETEQGPRTTTMRIVGMNIKGKEYLLPSYDPDTKSVIDTSTQEGRDALVEKFLPLIEEGDIEGYSSPQEAEADRKNFYGDIIQEKYKGGLMYGNKQNKKMHGGGHAKKDYSKYKKMNMGGYTGGMTQAMGMNPMFDETEEVAQMNCGGMMSADVIVGIDPVSGNEIPVGSDAENVRDDIPAMLSEEEYVLPANVVKWHGLKHIQEMHDEASMGLMSMAMDGLVATGNSQGKTTEKYNTEKKSRKTEEGNEVEIAAYEIEDKADLKKDKKSKEYGKGGLLGYAEGGLVDEDPDPYGDLFDKGFEFDSEMMNAELIEEIAAEQRERDAELEPYMQEDSLSEEDAAELFDADDEAGLIDMPEGDGDTKPVSKSDDEEKSADVNKVAAALLKQAGSYGGGEDSSTAFMSGLGNGVKMAQLGKGLGDKLAAYETKSGSNPFGFLRDDKGFFQKR
tara:strand:- start:1729 stop:3165 length:1437 start_codon:yes stop_codon:yes gene_type:complete